MRSPLSWLALLLVTIIVGIAFTAPVASATTVVRVTDADLVRSAAAIVVARVVDIRTVWNSRTRQVFTDVTVAVDEVLAGDVPTRSVTVRLLGGRIGDVHVWVDGNPEFQPGEAAVLFLSRGRDGRPRLAHLYQGKFSLGIDRVTGEQLAIRAEPPGVRVLPGAAAAARVVDVRRLEDLRRLVRAYRRAPGASAAASAPAATGDSTVTESSGAYTYLGSPSRWFEPDTGQPVPMFMDGAGEPAASTRGVAQVRDAYAAWNTVVGSAFRFADAGSTTARGHAFDGVNAISFRDPQGQLDPPSSCSGTLAVTVVYRSTTEARTVNGQSFFRILESDVVLADGWDGCGFYEDYANFSEVVTHELGHVLGLGHSADSRATMYDLAHFDGRGASLDPDDEAGARSMYPALALDLDIRSNFDGGTGTVTLNPPAMNCDSDCRQVYPQGTVVTLTARPAAGSWFVGWTGGGCSGTGTCTVTMTGYTPVSATFTDQALTLSITSPGINATIGGAFTVNLSANGGAGVAGNTYTFSVTVDGTTIHAGATNSFTWDTTRYPDGPRTLIATVTDSSGRTATASRTVTIANTSNTPSFTASITYPAEGATVRNSISVGMSTTAPWGQTKTWALYADGVEVMRRTHTGTTLWYTWNTTTTANGLRTLRLDVTNAVGQTAVGTRTVNVANTTTAAPPPPPPPPPLTAAITSPAAGATVSGTAAVAMSAGGASGPVTFALTVDGTEVSRQTVSGTTATYAWDTTAVANGSRTLGLTVIDGGRTATTSRSVNVSNTTTATPATFTASFQFPGDGATVSGTKSIGMATSAPWGEAKTWVLRLDGLELMRTITTGTTLWWRWSTTPASNGLHELTLAVTDSAGGTATARITVQVEN